MPSVSSPPGRLSITNGCPHDCDSAWPRARARMSVTAPGDVGTMSLTVRLGYWSCAKELAAPKARQRTPASMLVLRHIIFFLPLFGRIPPPRRSLVVREYLARERGSHDLNRSAGDHEAAGFAP